jgi:hypothetical protein
VNEPDDWAVKLAAYEAATAAFAHLEMQFVAQLSAGAEPTAEQRNTVEEARSRLAAARLPLLHRLLKPGLD